MTHTRSLLLDAHVVLHGDRAEAYGHPADNLGRTARLWTELLGVPVTAEQVALCLIAVKLSRHVHQPKRDNLLDIAGYAEAADLCRPAP